jgi:hypothetical protein
MEAARHRLIIRGAALALTTAITAAATPVRANGAFPDEFSVHFPPDAADRIIVGANFGMMASDDRGATWRYVCEPWVTTGSSDPLAVVNVVFYQVAADGAVLANTTPDGTLRRSGDGGCTWQRSTGAIDGATVTDFFPSPTDPTFVVAITVSASMQGSSLWPSHDGGKTFDTTALYTSKVLISSAEIARTAPGTMYVTLSSTNEARLVRSTDSGKTWSAPVDIPKVNGVLPQPRVLAIDPEDADTVYLRLLAPPYDAIAVSAGGATPVTLLTINGVFSAFARGTDRTLYAGTPDSKLYIRPPGGSFPTTPIPGARFRCLGERLGTSDLYACADMFQDGFSVGVSRDAGRTFQKVMKLPELQGPLTCAPVQTACAAHWARIQSVLTLDAGTPAADAGGGPSQSGKGGCSSIEGAALAALAALTLAFRRRARTGCRTGNA